MFTGGFFLFMLQKILSEKNFKENKDVFYKLFI